MGRSLEDDKTSGVEEGAIGGKSIGVSMSACGRQV